MAKSFAAFYDLPPWFEKMDRLQRQLESITRPLTMMQIDSQLISQNLAVALNVPAIHEMENLARLCEPNLVKMLQQEQKLLAQSAPLVEIQSQLSARVFDWSRTLFDTVPYQYDSLRLIKEQELSKWTQIADRIAGITIPVEADSDEVYELSEEEQQTIAAEITTIFADEKNWEQRFMESVAKFQEIHPFWAVVLKFIIVEILLAIAINLASTAIGQAINATKMYEEPSTTSHVVYHIEQHQTVIVMGEVPYYYEVEIKDDATEQITTGYVSKRSIQIYEDTDTDINTTQAE